jgi:ribonuclease/clavin/mitogillin
MPAEPRTAAACILLRGDAEPQVLLAKRGPALRFMAGHHVFPGGRVDDSERVDRVAQAKTLEDARSISAVAREVFEETGLLCVRGTLPDGEASRHARRRLLNDDATFTDLLEQHDLYLDAADFEPAGEWLTPPFVPIRFATRYFLFRLQSAQQEELIEGEIVALDWLTPALARQRWHRGEIHVSTPVAYTLRQLAAAAQSTAALSTAALSTASLSTVLSRLQRGTSRAPGEHNWFEIRRGITLVPVQSATLPPATHTNCMLIGEQELYIVDPGAKDAAELDHLVRQIDHLVELGGKCVAVLLTHTHPDHIDAADQLRARYDVPIMAHPAAEAHLPFAVDRHLHDGEVLLSGRDPQWRLRCLHTPGHDPSHLCFLEESTGALLAGDMVANPGTIVVSRKYGGDMGDFMKSLERLIALDCKLVIPAHGQPVGQPREFIAKQIAHRKWREEKIRRAYDEGATTCEELLRQAYDDAPQESLAWARHSLDAHLAKLGISMAIDL